MSGTLTEAVDKAWSDIEIVNRAPPIIDKIVAVFPKAAEPGVLFAYDGKIYNPGGKPVHPALVAHETLHLTMQVIAGCDEWWDQYLRDQEFRYYQELIAHSAEYVAQLPGLDRNQRAKVLMATATRLIAPLYQYEPPKGLQNAMRDIREYLTRSPY